MKRSPLHRKPRRPSLNEPGRVEWKTERAGWCAVCERFQLRLAHHHVIYEQHVRREHGDPWDPANGMYVCDICHRHHHDAFARIPAGKIPAEANAFAVGLLGFDAAALYFARYYGSRQAA